MRMGYEGKIVFTHKEIIYRECAKVECMWNINWEELCLAEQMAGRPLPKKFEGRVCNCVPENPMSIIEASRVKCYPTEE